jgi:cation/acetate symporter
VDLLSLGIALVLGTAGLPHILIRFYTVPSARTARRSVLWAIGIIGTFYLFTLALGFGAAALVGGNEIRTQNPGGNTAAPQLAQALGFDFFGGDIGGVTFLAVIAAVAFATILAVVAGLTLASSSSLSHDLYANVITKGTASERQEVVVARVSALVIGAVSIVLGILAKDLNVAFLVALAFAVAASGNLPAILFSLFWKRFNTSGAVWDIYGGLISCVVLVFFSPVVSGAATSMFPKSDWQWFPLSNPGIISIPFGFFCGWLGTILSSERNADKYAELEVRSLTGAGAH